VSKRRAKPPTDDELFGQAAARVADNLRRLRSDADLSQEAVAERTGHAVRHIQRVEAGDVNPSLRLLVLLAASVGADPAELLAPIEGSHRARSGTAKRRTSSRRRARSSNKDR